MIYLILYAIAGIVVFFINIIYNMKKNTYKGLHDFYIIAGIVWPITIFAVLFDFLRPFLENLWIKIETILYKISGKTKNS